jgi:hypothetical protein
VCVTEHGFASMFTKNVQPRRHALVVKCSKTTKHLGKEGVVTQSISHFFSSIFGFFSPYFLNYF